jgi:hypothetical protein
MDLLQFCGLFDHRAHLNTPFNFEGRTIASNGHILISIPQEEGHPKIVDHLIAPVSKILDQDGFKFQPIQDIEFPDPLICSACDGGGKAEFEECKECRGCGSAEASNDYHTYDVLCRSCDGNGYIVFSSKDMDCRLCNGRGNIYNRSEYIYLCGVKLDPNYAKQVVDIEGVQVFGKGQTLYFQSGDIIGALKGIVQR